MIGAMTSQDTQRTDAPGRLLRWRTSDRVIGGVAGGLGDYFNVDPLLIRIGFVGLIIFGGAGLVLYLLGWLLIPAEGRDLSPVEAVIRWIGLTPARIITFAIVAVLLGLLINSWNIGVHLPGGGGMLWAVSTVVVAYLLIRYRETLKPTAGGSVAPMAIAIGVAAVIFISSFPIGGPFDGSGYLYLGRLSVPPWALLAVAVIVVGYLLIRRRETSPATAGVAAAPSVGASTTIPMQPVAPVVKAPPRPRSPLGWYVVAATLIAVGLLAIISQAAKVEVAPGQFFGAGLTVIGIGLVVGAWWGRARILILLALLLLPMAVTASFITAPLEGGIGDLRYAPMTGAELRPEYRLMGGRLVLDLTGLSLGPRSVEIAVSVAVGGVRVILPEGASVQMEARVGAGATYLFDSQQVGTSLDDRLVRRHLHATTYILDLEAGIGEVQVVTQHTESN
jgi:phage shock protein PspC (stress-responsive transcriptional regulator)